MLGEVEEKVATFDGQTARRFVRKARGATPQERAEHLGQLFRRYSARAHAPFAADLRRLFAVGRLPLERDEWYVVRVEQTSYLCCRLIDEGVPIFLIALADEEDFRLAWEAGCWFSVGAPLPQSAASSGEEPAQKKPEFPRSIPVQ